MNARMKTAARSKQACYGAVKRCFDIFGSLAASILLLLPMGVIALVILWKDPGNPFFLQKRVGQDGKDLYILKFRSMKAGADDLTKALSAQQMAEYSREYKLKDDPRLIGYEKPGDASQCFGAMLRKTSIDELPQIPYNILFKGDMSLVGPRPILRQELEDHYTPEQQARLLSIKPGLTGYWQVAGNHATYETGLRQQMELHYVQNRSLWMDVKVLFQTVGCVIRKTGAK